MSTSLRDVYHRISDRLGGESAISAVGDFICSRTRLEDRPFSFKDHEFQIAICNDTSRHAVVQKPTQVGLTELSLRIALALMCLRQHFPLIYVLPSAHLAAEVSKTRVDPIIEESDYVRGMLVTAANSAMVKRIGSSVLYMAGAATKRQAISRPAKALIMDEKDFCNQTVSTSYYGRLRHTLVDEQFIREFSTPTVADYGINKALLASSRQRYTVRCQGCNERQAPDFAKQVTIPGYDRDFSQFTRDDLVNFDCSKAYLRCSKCGKDLHEALLTPEDRLWVPMHPDVPITGWEVKPFDLPKYNTIPQLVQSFGNYDDEADYWNFVQGEVKATDTNQINGDNLRNCMTLQPLSEAGAGFSMGVDVGAKQVFVTIGRKERMPDGTTKVRVPYRVCLRIEDGLFFGQIKKLMDYFKIERMVIDQRPDFSLSGELMEFYAGMAHAANYINDKKGSLTYIHLLDNGLVQLERTRAFNSMVQEINQKKWEFAAGSDNKTFVSHMMGMKRVGQQNEQGEVKQAWVKVGEDHYMHSCLYLRVAIEMSEQHVLSDGPAVLPHIGGVTVGKTTSASGSAQTSGRIDVQVAHAASILGITKPR